MGFEVQLGHAQRPRDFIDALVSSVSGVEPAAASVGEQAGLAEAARRPQDR